VPCFIPPRSSPRQRPRHNANADAHKEMETVPYEPPCRAALKARVDCEACGKRVSLGTLRYRHTCIPALERVRRGTHEANAAVRARAEEVVDAEKAAKFARLLKL